MFANKHPARSLTAFLVTWSFLILTISGVVLYIVPQGRIAYWVHWGLWGLEKEDWGHVHMMFGGLFIVTGILHLYFNWKPFKKYLAERISGQYRVSRELAISLLLSILILAGSIWEVPPVSWVFDLNKTVKDAWVTGPDLEPPFGHAEEISLAGIARRMNLDLPKAEQALLDAGFKVADRGDSLDRIARDNDTTPMAIYGVIRRFPLKQEATAPLKPLTAEELEAKFAGTGLGRKGVNEVAAAAGIAPAQARARLLQAGVQYGADETLRDIAERQGVSPIDLLKIMATESAGEK